MLELHRRLRGNRKLAIPMSHLEITLPADWKIGETRNIRGGRFTLIDDPRTGKVLRFDGYQSPLYTQNAQAGYRQGMTGKPPAQESEECKNGRFGYCVGFSAGAKKHREEMLDDDLTAEKRAERFFSIW